MGLVKLRFPILQRSLLSSFSRWCLIAATRPSKWTVSIMSGYRDFQCPGSYDLENSDLPMADIPMTTPHVGTSLLAPAAYLPRSFCRSDDCRPFGKFEWDPTVTGSLSSFSSANSCILSFVAHIFLNVVPPELSRPNPQGILSFLSGHLHCCTCH
jgi:hypothetical protein